MAKSTAAAALASLSYKFQSKIREVGFLKAQVKRLTNDTAKDIAQAEVVQKLQVELKRLALRNDNDTLAFDRLTSTLRLVELRAISAEQAYSKLQAHTRDVDGVLADLRDSVGNWKSLSAVLCVVGIAIGSLGTLAYIAQTTPL